MKLATAKKARAQSTIARQARSVTSHGNVGDNVGEPLNDFGAFRSEPVIAPKHRSMAERLSHPGAVKRRRKTFTCPHCSEKLPSELVRSIRSS